MHPIADMDETILLVDDEPGIRKVLGLTLADMGYRVLTAENGESALPIFEEHRPPIVFTDIKMPGIDGIQLLEKIKSMDADTEVIMISGHGDMELAIESLKLAACDFITKPINNDALEIALKRAREKILMRRQLREYTENLETLVAEKSAKLVDMERAMAVNQAVEGMSAAMSDIAGDLAGDIQYFNEMPCLVAIHDASHRIVAVNALFKERMGNRIGQGSGSIYRCKDTDPAACPAARTFSTGKGQRSRQSVQYANGREGTLIVHTAPIRNSKGQVQLVIEISADVTEINRLQKELDLTQRRYQQLFDAVPCYITVQDRDLKIAAANRTFKAQFESKNTPYCYKAYRGRKEPCRECPVAKTFEDGRSHQAEMTVIAKAGQPHSVLIQTAPLFDEKGTVFQVMEMATDITQIRRLQDNLSTLGLMVGTISHSIKGVLTGLDAGLYFLESGLAGENADRTAEGVDMVKLMVDRIRNVVLNILYYAKERTLKSESVNLETFVSEISQIMKTKIRGRAVGLEYTVDPSAESATMDRVMIRTALLNILENAVEACLEDKDKPDHVIRIKVTGTETHIIFAIEDNGTGMDAVTREKLFTLFFSSKGHTGTGLGLFISKDIVTRHGGDISVTTVIGKGARFVVRLPRKLPEEAKPEPAGRWRAIVQ